LHADKLIHKDDNYKIEHQNGVFKINGKEQPADVYNKYKSFLQKHKEFTINKSDDDFDIDID
jgi:hypothetical protein